MVRIPLLISAGTAVALAFAAALGAAAAEESAPDVLVSRQLAAAFDLATGSRIVFSTDPLGGNPREFHVAGVYEPTPDPMAINSDKHEVRLHLPDLLALTTDPADPLAMGAADAINISLVDPGDAPAFARDVTARVPGIRARRALGGLRESGTFVVLERFHLAIAVVTMIASTMFLLALSVMLVDERRETAGILRLIGLSTRRIMAQLFVEGLFIAVAGALFGLALALASEGLINRYFQWRYDTALIFVQITPAVALRCVTLAVPLGACASIAASWLLLRRSVLSLARR